eukprot:g5710.t1
MASFLRKAARMNLVAMDFVLQVTVVELVLGALDADRTLSFELSRGTKTSGLPPKVVSTTRSEWRQTMQVVITLFLDRRSGRFQDKEYKLRLVQAEKGHVVMAPALATFTLDASLYAHLGAGPSVEQTVDLYAPKLNGPGGDATVHLRVRCCEPRGKGGSVATRSVSAPNVLSSVASLQVGLPPRGASQPGQMGLPLPPPEPTDPSLLVGSSFGFSMSGSESRYSAVSGSMGSSLFSTPIRRRPGRPWSNEDLDQLSTRSRSSMRSSLRSKLGSKSFNDLDDSEHYSAASSKRSGSSAPHHRALRSSFSSFGGLLGSMGGSSSGVGVQRSPGHHLALSGRRAAAAAAADGAAVSPGTGVLTSESSSSASSFIAAERRSSSPGGSGSEADGGAGDGRGGGGGGGGHSNLGSAAAVPTCTAAGVPYDRTTTVGWPKFG